MTEVELTEKDWIIHVMGADKLLAFKSELKVPLTHVTGVELGAPEEGWKVYGSYTIIHRPCRHLLDKVMDLKDS